ncbi:uncharacterized protein LOC105700754 [Orussus abietinus]|uniref:uncharacterized protein LOC105700754 n=1 Tax=Orussus abietinus TaxID=222816 RepID=UPI000C71619E|nr:uncharacterized protein LOC105700754 [Orussus abietinus]
MGCAPSGTTCKSGGLRLMATKLSFTKEQLEKLNSYYSRLIEDAAKPDVSGEAICIEAVVERLVQRLVAGMGNLDPRFSSMFLVSLNERRRVEELKFEYLVRIDGLSSPGVTGEFEAPVRVEEDPGMPGFARLRIRGSGASLWAEFLGPEGRLRRDLIKAKMASLLALATKQGALDGVDERLCLAPGQVVDPEVLDKILKQPDHCRVFYGPASAEVVLPEPKDHRVVLVEDSGGILLKLGLKGMGTREVEVRLVVGASASSWPALADFPKRVPLHHCDALLYYNAAQTGMYVVAVGPYPGARCEDRATLWKVRFPAAETAMRTHYAEDSVPGMVDSVLMRILSQLREKRVPEFSFASKDTPRVVSRQVLRTVHRWALERAGPDPLGNWAPETLSRHVLLVLDETVTALRCQSLRCYFYPRSNVMLQCARGGILHHEDSYMSDSRLLEQYLQALHRQALDLKTTEPRPADLLENELIDRWRRVVTSLPRGTMGGHYGYSSRQLEYLGLVVQEVLRANEVSLQSQEDHSFLSFESSNRSSEPIESLVYLLTTVSKQARDQVYAMTSRRGRKRGHRKTLKRRKRGSASFFERSLDVLVDVVRRDRETAYTDLENHVIMAKTLLRWLYFAAKNDRKTLGPILRPYLGNLFNSSHENAWHVESWRKRREIYSSEVRSLAMFSKLVMTQEMSPANGIVEFLSKGWTWAENVARMIERSKGGLRLVFVDSDKIVKYNLTFANDKGLSAYSTWSKPRNAGMTVRRANLARTKMITEGFSKLYSNRKDLCKGPAGHVDLREWSPLTNAVSLGRRRGRQRGPGGLIPALVALNKFRILQEVAVVLPQDERTAMLDVVQKVAREASRRLRRASCPDTSTSGSPRQIYTPRSENGFPESPIHPPVHQRGGIAERRMKMHREVQDLQDTLSRRGTRSKSPFPVWDAASVTSWTSSVRSCGRTRLGRRIPTWEVMRGTSPMWDSVSTDGSFAKYKSEEMTSREDSPEWGHRSSRGRGFGDRKDPRDSKDCDLLPSWDFLDESLDRKLSKLDDPEPDSLEANRDVGIDYLVTANERKEVTTNGGELEIRLGRGRGTPGRPWSRGNLCD